ncbi:MAG TPA: DUF1801 domain-containing protein [Chitinophagaceae bacterium]
MEKSAKAVVPKNVDEYLNALPDDVRITLEQLRQTIRTAAPKAEEVISYQIPTYKYKGALVHFAAFKDHCSFFGVSKDIISIFAKELEPFKAAGTTIHFSPQKPLPSSLVKKMVKARVKENEERSAAKGR